MKRKVKKFAGDGESVVKDFASTGPDVEEIKTRANEGKGIFSGNAAPDESDTYAAKTRTFTTVKPNRPKPRPRPAAKAESSSPVDDMDFQQNAAMVMRKGQAGERPTQRMTNAPLDKLKADRKAAAFNAERKAAAEERKKTARSTTSAVPYDSVNPNQYKMFEKDSYKKGGKTASSRADGCAIRGKTRA